MNLTQLRYFQAVCRYGTVTQSSKFLQITQPSISNAIKELEDEFGVILFKRQYRGMTLTPEGEIFLDMTNKLLDEAASLCQVMDDIGKKRHLLRLGIPPMISSIILPTIYRDFFLEHPEVNVQIIECGQRDLLRKLADDELDMVILPHASTLEPAYRSVPITSLETVCCTSHHHPLAQCESVSVEDLKNEKLVLFKESFFQTELIMARFFNIQKEPNIILQTSQLSTVIRMISSNIAIGFLFIELVEASPEVISIPLSPRMLVQTSLVWKADSYPFRHKSMFIEYIKHAFGQR